MHIAFVASECVPFSKTGGLADVVGALPKALANLGHQISVYITRYRPTRTYEPKLVVESLIWQKYPHSGTGMLTTS